MRQLVGLLLLATVIACSPSVQTEPKYLPVPTYLQINENQSVAKYVLKDGTTCYTRGKDVVSCVPKMNP